MLPAGEPDRVKLGGDLFLGQVLHPEDRDLDGSFLRLAAVGCMEGEGGTVVPDIRDPKRKASREDTAGQQHDEDKNPVPGRH
jgi:hypothetical protein